MPADHEAYTLAMQLLRADARQASRDMERAISMANTAFENMKKVAEDWEKLSLAWDQAYRSRR